MVLDQRFGADLGFVVLHMGGLSKLGSLFGYPEYEVPYYNRDPKRGPNFDNHPYIMS